LVLDGLFQGGDDGIGRFLPADMLQHHDAGEEQGGRIDLVQAGVLGRRAVGGLEHRHLVADVGAGGDADAADLSGQGIGQVVAVQVEGGQHIEFLGPQQRVLEHDVGDAVLDDHLARGLLALVALPQFVFGDGGVGEFLPGQLVAPVPEGAFGELHDVALVDQGYAAASPLEGVVDGHAHQALGAEGADGLDADARVLPQGNAQLVGQELPHPGGFRGVVAPLDALVDVLGVFAEDDHVHVAGVGHRAGHAGEPAHRPDACIQIQFLTNGYVQAAEAAPHGGGQRPLDADGVFLEGFQGFPRQPGPQEAIGFFTGVHFVPENPPLAAIGVSYRRVDYLDRCPPNVWPGAVTFDEWNDGIFRYLQLACLYPDRLSIRRGPVIL